MRAMWLAALAVAAVSGGQAKAAVFTRSFNVTASTFNAFGGVKAPFSSLSADITLTYDDAISGFLGAPTQFRVITDGRVNGGPFSAAPLAGYFPPDAMRKVPRIVISGTLSGASTLTANSNDFFIGFDDGPSPFVSVAFTRRDHRRVSCRRMRACARRRWQTPCRSRRLGSCCWRGSV